MLWGTYYIHFQDVKLKIMFKLNGKLKMTSHPDPVCDMFKLTVRPKTSHNSDIFGKLFNFGFDSSPLEKSWLRANTLAPASDAPLYGIFVPQKVPTFENFWWRHCM